MREANHQDAPATQVTDARGDHPPGLSEAEVERRRAAGHGNTLPPGTGRTYGEIVRENVFNPVHNLLFALGATLLVLGRFLDAFVSVGVVLANSAVSLFQEIRAKRTLDRVAILTRPHATVVRDGKERQVDPSEIVLGDVLRVGSGDQIVVDGTVVGKGFMEVDESLLTGESDLVPKHPGDTLLSGSYCVTGAGYYGAERVGNDSFANKITAQAQMHRRILTPLQKQVSVIVRVLLWVVIAFEVLVVVRSLVGGIPFVESVRMSTVIVALIPNGLILAIALAYALGAVRMAGKGTMIQQANAVESLANVDVLCTDKTGTLTTNVILMHDLLPLSISREELEGALGDFVASASERNRTAEAILAAFGGTRRVAMSEALFSSARKWSGLALDDPERRGTYVLGAPEILKPALTSGAAAEASADTRVNEWTAAGLRVLLFAWVPAPRPFAADGKPPELPRDLAPLGLVALRDELRPNVQDTLHEFAEAGIEVKVISGDNPQTVASLATQAGLGGEFATVAGPELEAMDPAAFARVAAEARVFGRVTPEQKQALVEALHQRGRYVAMIGDGVNDVIALKQANLGIAMEGGSQAARGVADMVLLGDSFAALPAAFREGQRIRNGMQDILKIFMVRILSKASLIAIITVVGGFPFAPRQSSLLTFLAAGVPTVGFATWAKPGPSPKGHLYRALFRFAVPAVVMLVLVGLGIYLAELLPAEASYRDAHPDATAAQALEHALPTAQTATAVFTIICSILLIPFTVPPTWFFVGGEELRGDWRPTILAAGLMALFVGIMALPLGRELFEFQLLSALEYALIVAVALLWMFTVRWLWRRHVFDRLFGRGG